MLTAVTVFGLRQWHRSPREDRRELGERLYIEQSCVACHGPLGHGDGTKADALNPPPRDFRSRSAYVQGTTARDVANTLKTGVVVHPSQMPSFAHLSDEQRLALGEFIVSLQRAPNGAGD